MERSTGWISTGHKRNKEQDRERKGRKNESDSKIERKKGHDTARQARARPGEIKQCRDRMREEVKDRAKAGKRDNDNWVEEVKGCEG